MKNYISGDLYRYAGRVDLKTLLKYVLNNPCFRYIFFLRVSSRYLKYHPFGILARFFYRRYTFKYNIQIPKNVKIGPGLMIIHFGGIVINSRSEIGANCTILHGVTIGNTKRGTRKGAPRLGDNVYLGPGAVVVGRIRIGNNVMIAPNSFVNVDVPDDSLVIGNPAKITPRIDATVGYIQNPI